MEPATIPPGQLGATSKRFAQRLLALGGNRLELLWVELQEAHEHFLHSLLLALGVAVFGALAGVALTGAVVVLLWEWSPAGALVGLTVVYAGVSGVLYHRLLLLQRDWKVLSATLAQLKEDRVCLEQSLS